MIVIKEIEEYNNKIRAKEANKETLILLYCWYVLSNQKKSEIKDIEIYDFIKGLILKSLFRNVYILACYIGGDWVKSNWKNPKSKWYCLCLYSNMLGHTNNEINIKKYVDWLTSSEINKKINNNVFNLIIEFLYFVETKFNLNLKLEQPNLKSLIKLMGENKCTLKLIEILK